MFEKFINPPKECLPVPFWFWNDDLQEDEIVRQIKDFKEKGIGGFVLHPRMGIPETLPYLSERFLDLTECAVREAKRLELSVILYDEAMYPSGSAHGGVVATNPEFASRGLCAQPFTTKPVLGEGDELYTVLSVPLAGNNRISSGEIQVVEKPYMNMQQQSLLALIVTYTQGRIRGIHFGEDDGQMNAPRSADLLNPEAVKLFISLTHEVYYKRLGQYFGDVIKAMFTDEPLITGRGGKQGVIPWTKGFETDFSEEGGCVEELPFLWYDGDVDTRAIRGKYERAVMKRLEKTYYKLISQWCTDHGIALTGHPAESDDIGLLRYFHIPGQDVVLRRIAPEKRNGIIGKESTMGKCSSDSARHRGKRRNANECFGACNRDDIDWNFTFDDMKWYMDWLFVRGVNLLMPHAFYYSVSGERAYERPPDVGPNNQWWYCFKDISSYIGSMSWIHVDSYNTTPVAVLCQHQLLPWKDVAELFENQIEFNYLEEDLLLESTVEHGWICIQKQRYKAIIISDELILGPCACAMLKNFSDDGGIVLYGQKNLTERIRSLHLNEVVLKKFAPDIRVAHVVKDGINLYMLVNEGEKECRNSIRLKYDEDAQLWDGWRKTCVTAEKDDFGICFTLGRRESIIIAVGAGKMLSVPKHHGLMREHIVDEGWTAEINGKQVYPALGDWSKSDGLEKFSGACVYKNTFILNQTSQVVIDLGEVYDIAFLRINGKPAGVCLYAPYILDVSKFVCRGENTMEIEVRNSMANHYSGAHLASGLLGRIRICIGE